MRLPKDILSGTYTKPHIFLCEVNKQKIGKLETTETKGSFKFNSLSELSFEVARVYNDIITGETKVNPFFDKIEALRLIYVENFGYFELQGPELISDGVEEKKSCKAYSLEYTLAQKYLENFYVNMGTVESIEVINTSSERNIAPITLYNPTNPKLSLLHLVLEEIYGWKIGYVSASLQTLSRQFEVDRESVYDFLMNEVCEKFNCYIVFDTINNTINVYAESLTAKFIGDGKTSAFTITPPFEEIGTVSVDGYKTTRWAYNQATGALILEDTPKSGAHIEAVDGALTEWETDVFVSFDNLAQEANISYSADDIKTRLTVTYGDDYDIREVNLGLPYLTDISYYYTVDWMGQDLYDAYTKYLQKSNESQSAYTNNSQEILKINDHISYEENRLSLEYSLVESVSGTTIGTYYTRQENLDGSYYYSEVSLPSEYIAGVDYYSNVTTNVNEEKVGNLYTILKKYFYAYFNSSAEDMTSTLDELKGLLGFDFMETYTLIYLHDSLKATTSQSQIDTAIYNFLGELWIELGRTPLKTLYLDPYKTIQEANIQAGWSNKSDQNYGYYYPVILFINSIESAIAERDTIIQSYESQRSKIQANNVAISNSLLMRNNFTEEQLIRLSAFLREDELHLDDIVETDLDDLSSSFKIKQDAMESGRIELQKICQPQLQFSMTMANIYALPEFEPIINQFQLGRVIRVALRPDYQKQSRLLQVNINFDDLSDFSCEFGELTSLRTQSDIHADLLSQAITAGKSVATNSSYWTRGSDQATALDLKIQQGLLDATTQIKAIDGSQGVVIDKWGIKLQKKNTDGSIDPKQTWLVNNMILMSDDGFATSRSALGEITVDGETYYGLVAEMILSGYIESSTIKGGTIQIGEYTDENGDKKYAFEVDEQGNVTMSSSNISGYATDDELTSAINKTESEFKIVTDKITAAVYDEDGESRIEQTAKSIELKVGYNDVISAINMSEEGIKIDANKLTIDTSELEINASNIKLEGLITANENFKVLEDGSIEAKNATISGNITATSLTLGNNVSISTDNIDGLSNVATSGNYSDLSGLPSIPESLSDLTDGDNVMRTSDISVTTTTSDDGITTTVTTVGDNEYITYTSSDANYLLTNLGVGEEDGTYFMVEKDGLLTAKNAMIWGTIYATNGEFSGNISASTIEGSTIEGGSLLIGDKTSESYAEITSDGILNCSGANITGTITATSGTIGQCEINEDGKLIVPAANITGELIIGQQLPANIATTDDIPTNVSQLNNDSGYQTETGVTTIIDGTVTTDFVNALNVAAGSVAAENITGEIISGKIISGGSITIGDNFSVSETGVLTCSSAKIGGVLTAGVGSSLGGFKTDSNSLYFGSWGTSGTTPPAVFMCTGSTGSVTLAGHTATTGNGWCFGAGENFGVTQDGSLYASHATITGGQIGNWNISDNGLIGSNNKTYIYKNGTFCFRPSDYGYYCGFMDEGDITGNTGIYVFVIGGNAKLKIGSTTLSEDQLKSLLALI